MKWRPSLAQQRSSGHSVATAEANTLVIKDIY
jgi:hypothetical protein